MSNRPAPVRPQLLTHRQPTLAPRRWLLGPLLAAALAAVSCTRLSSSPHADPTGSPPRTPALRVEEGFFPGSGGLRLFYRKLGSGAETVVFLHGGPVSLSDGGYDLDELAQGRTLLMFEQRSGARSEHVTDPEKRKYQHYVQDVEAFRKHFGLERLALLGNSWGATLSVLYAAEYPERVSRLLLLSPGPVAESFWPERLAKTEAATDPAGRARLKEIYAALDHASDQDLPGLCREMVRISFRPYLNNPALYDRMKVQFCPEKAADIRYEFGGPGPVSDSLGKYDLRPLLAKISVPILVIEGADTVVPLNSTRAFAEHALDARLLLLPRTGHAVFLEGGAAFFNAADQFFRGTWPQDATRLTQASSH